MKELNGQKTWTAADTWFCVFLIVCFILYEIVAGEASAGQFVYTPDRNPITFDVQFEVRVDGELIDMGLMTCPETALPPGFNPLDCPDGYECRSLPGKANQRLREAAKKKVQWIRALKGERG